MEDWQAGSQCDLSASLPRPDLTLTGAAGEWGQPRGLTQHSCLYTWLPDGVRLCTHVSGSERVCMCVFERGSKSEK